MFTAVGRARELRQRYGCRDRARHRQQTGAHLLKECLSWEDQLVLEKMFEFMSTLS
jgi:hypothetical protein